jgi:hypothetical protein
MRKGISMASQSKKRGKSVLVKIHLTVPVHRRLRMAAVAYNRTVSGMAEFALDIALPRLPDKIDRETARALEATVRPIS